MSSGSRQENLKDSSPARPASVPSSDEPWELAGWSVHPASNELVHQSGRRARLEARAMSVLQVLRENAGEVVTSETLLDRVWEGKVVSPHSVTTVISDLRKVLSADPALASLIETIPKRGYRLHVPQDAHRSAPSPRNAWLNRRTSLLLAGAVALVLVAAVLVVPGMESFGLSRARAIESTRTAQFVRARQLWSLREHDATIEARRLLTELIAQDETFAPAHAALADIYAHKTGNELGLKELDTFRAAQRSLDRARALDPGLPEAFVTQAVLDFYRDNQPLKALATVNEALQRDQEFASAWQTRAMLLSVLGRHEESLSAIGRARTLDPASNSIGWDEVWFLYLADEPERAQAAFERESTRSQPIYLYGALISQQRGDTVRAVDFWLRRLKDRGAQIPDPAGIEAAAKASPTASTYAELLRQVQSLDGYEESRVVLATWHTLAGEPVRARELLAGLQPERSSWLTFWAPEMPALATVSTLSN